MERPARSADLAVRCRGVHKSFGAGAMTLRVLRGVDLEARYGQMTFLLGPSGSGKTTLLSIIAGLLHHDAGAVEVLGRDLTKLRDGQGALFRLYNVGFVFQQINLIPALTAAENAAVPLLAAGSLDTPWELSFWSGTAKRYSAAKADVEAGRQSLEPLRLIVSAETARAYFELRGFERQLAAARRNRAAQAELLALTQERARAGLAPGLDVERQRASLASPDAAMEPLEWQRRLRLHRLALLTGGRGLAERGIDAAPLDEMRLPALGDGVDSALLERRPDVRAAQARIQAAMARRRSAKADLLPRVLLTGLAGRQGTSVAGLSLGAGTFFGVGPQLVLPVFTGGRLRAQIDAADARLEQARIEFEREVLAAFLGAEDALAGYRAQRARLDQLQQARLAATTSLDLATELYRAGVGDYLAVLEAQRVLLDPGLAAAEAENAAAVQSALLFKALAGGWPERPGT